MGLAEDAAAHKAQRGVDKARKSADQGKTSLAAEALLKEFATEMRHRSIPTTAIYETRIRDLLFHNGSGPTRTLWAGAEIGRGWLLDSSADADAWTGTHYVLFDDGRFALRSMYRRKILFGIEGGPLVPCVEKSMADIRSTVNLGRLREGIVNILSRTS